MFSQRHLLQAGLMLGICSTLAYASSNRNSNPKDLAGRISNTIQLQKQHIPGTVPTRGRAKSVRQSKKSIQQTSAATVPKGRKDIISPNKRSSIEGELLDVPPLTSTPKRTSTKMKSPSGDTDEFSYKDSVVQDYFERREKHYGDDNTRDNIRSLQVLLDMQDRLWNKRGSIYLPGVLHRMFHADWIRIALEGSDSTVMQKYLDTVHARCVAIKHFCGAHEIKKVGGKFVGLETMKTVEELQTNWKKFLQTHKKHKCNTFIRELGQRLYQVKAAIDARMGANATGGSDYYRGL